MRYFSLIVFLIISLLGQAQGFRSRYYEPFATDNITKAVVETSLGNYIMGGFVSETENGHAISRLFVMGLNSQGQTQWTKKYGNYKFQYLNNSFVTRWFYKQNNYIYFSSCVRDSNNKQIGVLIKFNFSGDSVWQKVYRDSTSLIPQRVTGSVDGGFLITGFFDGVSGSPAMILKTDANGNELWRKKIHKNFPDVQDGRAIVQDTLTKRIVTTGLQYIGDSAFWDGYINILVMDSLGNLEQRQTFGTQHSLLFDLIQTRDKNFAAVGSITKTLTPNGDFLCKSYAIKFNIDSLAAPVWSLEAGFTTYDNFFSSITELKNGDLLIGGIEDTLMRLHLPGNCLIGHFRLTSSGNLINHHYYNYKTNSPNDNNSMTMQCLYPTSDGGAIAAIESQNYSPSNNPFFIVKYDSLGCDSTLAYCANIAAGIGSTLPDNNSVSVYPNPSNGNLNINFSSSLKVDDLYATFFDLYGREIKQVPLEEAKNALDINGLGAGIYLLKVSNAKKEFLYQEKLIKY